MQRRFTTFILLQLYKNLEPGQAPYYVINDIKKIESKDGSYSLVINYTTFNNYMWSDKLKKYIGKDAIGNYTNIIRYDKDNNVKSEDKGVQFY